MKTLTKIVGIISLLPFLLPLIAAFAGGGDMPTSCAVTIAFSIALAISLCIWLVYGFIVGVVFLFLQSDRGCAGAHESSPENTDQAQSHFEVDTAEVLAKYLDKEK